MRRLAAALLIAGAWLALPPGSARAVRVSAQQAEELKMLFVADVKRGGDALRTDSMFANMYLIGGGGHHTLSLETDDGLVLVDTKRTEWAERHRQKLRLGTANDATMIINTGVAGAMGNLAFPTATEIVAHENTKANLARMDAFKGEHARFLPNKTFSDKVSFPLKTVGQKDGTNRVDVFYFGPAHTNGDAIAVFPSFAIGFPGELFPDRAVPAVDLANGGSAIAFPDTLAKAVASLKGLELQAVIPAYGKLPFKVAMSWLPFRVFEEYAGFVRDLRDSARASHQAGKSVDEAVAALSAVSAKYKDYNMDRARAYVEAVYAELKK